ncbi:MAG: response regulator transcription factor [Bacteroidetes bacterium]|nr:response regulator transcription factor [Bacteroidota bacterium]
MKKEAEIKVIIVDDHKLFRKGMAGLLGNFKNCKVISEANNGEELAQQISAANCPDIVILDINMPVMDGYETAAWLKKNFPKVKILALSMNDSEEAIIKMLRAGANGYILKDAEPEELHIALEELTNKGFYHSDMVSGALLNNIYKESDTTIKNNELPELNERENEFLKFACTELTYKEIADKMFVAPRTVDGYREALFEKLNVKNRVGLVLYAIKHKKVKVV